MSCHGCTKKYSIFKKENGCPNCGYSYCSSCLKFKSVVPKLGKSEHLVCRSCQASLTDMIAKNSQPDHPAAFIQRLESLDNPAKPPITIYKHDHRMQQLKTGLSDSDRELANRLERLREDRKKELLPTDDEIAKRLALLKGQDSDRSNLSSQTNVAFTPDVRSKQQQADDLIQQYQDEQKLSSKCITPTEDITQRLAKLRGLEPSVPIVGNDSATVNAMAQKCASVEVNPHSTKEISMDEVNALLVQLRNEEKSHNKGAEKDVKECLKEIRTTLMKKNRNTTENTSSNESESEGENDEERIIQRVLDEAALEEKLSLSEVCEDYCSDNEELPWCVICNENAKCRCLGCDGDLYCESCFRQGHTDPDMKDHKRVPYKPKPTK